MNNKKLRWFLFTVIAVFVCALFGVTALACKKNPEPVIRVEGPETGVYYFDAEDGEYLITLNSVDKFAFMVAGENKSGTYTLEGETLTLAFNNTDDGTLTASYAESVITLTYKQSEMRFLKKINYSVTFNSYESVNVGSVSVINGRTVSKPADPVREGYEFLGWYADGEYKTPFAFNSDIITSDTVIYAKWGKTFVGQAEYEISFDLNYEGAENPSSVTTIGGKIYSVQQPVREGYAFNGWWISMSNRAEELSYVFSEEIVFTQNTTLFALWKSNAASTRLDTPVVNVKDGRISWTAVSGASIYELGITGPDGFVFETKRTNVPEENVAFVLAGDYVISVTAIASNEVNNSDPAIRLYRHKALNRVSHFEVAEPSVLVFNKVDNAESYYITVECGNPYHNHTEVFNGSSTNFNFANCAMQAGGIKFTVRAVAAGYADSVSSVFAYERKLDKIGGFTFEEATETLRWDAVANATDYTVTVNGTEFGIGNKTSFSLKGFNPVEGGLNVTVTPSTKGYVSPEAAEFRYEKTTLASPADIRIDGMTLSWGAVEGATSYEIDINGTVVTSETASIDLTNAVEWKNSEFYTLKIRAIGATNSLWSDDVDARRLAMFATLSYGEGILSWGHVIGATSYDVQVNDGEPFTVTGGANFTEIEFDRAGVNTLKVRFNDPAEISQEWVSMEVTVYTVVFDSRGGAGVHNLYRAAGDPTQFPETTRTGYDFVGWYSVPGGADSNGAPYEDEFFGESGDLYLYAYYTPKKYQVTLKLNGSEDDAYTNREVSYGRAFTFPVPTNTDETKLFGGWYSLPGGAGTALTDENGDSLYGWPFAEDSVAYAFWEDLILTYTPVTVDGIEGYEVSKEQSGVQPVITVPHTYMGKPVLKIADSAFGDSNSNEIVTLNIPDTIRIISLVNTFNGCANLEAINVYHVENNVLIRYGSDDGVLLDYGPIDDQSGGLADLIYVPQSKKGAFTISDKVRTISGSVFRNSKISSVTIPVSVTHIGNAAFEGSEISSVVFDGLSAAAPSLTIAERAFMNCKNLRDITLPARLAQISLTRFTYIDGNVSTSIDKKEVSDSFYGCSALSEINVAEGNATYSSANGVLYSGSRLVYFPVAKGGTFTLPSGAVTIADGAFFGNSELTSVSIPGFVTEIGECAFYNCAKLESVNFGGITNSRGLDIKKFAFYECDKLSALTFDDRSNVKTIGEGAFYACNSLIEVTVPGTVTNVSNDAFRNCEYLKTLRFADSSASNASLSFEDDIITGCKRLEVLYLPVQAKNIPLCSSYPVSMEIQVNPDNPVIKNAGNNVILSEDGRELLSYPLTGEANYTVPESVTKIGASAFRNRTVTSVTIGKNVTEIGAEAFADCLHLSTVIFEAGTENLVIGAGAFARCPQLSYFKIPARTVGIGENAFSLYIDANTKCATGFETVEFEDGFSMQTISAGMFAGTHLTDITIPKSVKVIGDSAFVSSSLVSVHFEDGSALEAIGADAFAYALSLESIKIPKTVREIRPSAFEECASLKTVEFEAGGTDDLTIGAPYRPEGAAGNENHERGAAFFNCVSLEEMHFPARTVSLGFYSFGNCDSLKTVTFAGEGEQSRLEFIDENAFMDSGLESIVIPKSVANRETLTLIIGSVQELYYRPAIGAGAFSGCGALVSVVFEAGGTEKVTISPTAFNSSDSGTKGCPSLERVVLPANLKGYSPESGVNFDAVSKSAFGLCPSLESITIPEGNELYASFDGVLYNAGFKEIYICPLGKAGTLELHDSIEVLNSSTFSGCSKITTIIIPGTFPNISNSMLTGLTGLTNIELKGDSSLYKTENGVLFSKDGSTLISVPINRAEMYSVPESVKAIGDLAFMGCKIQTISIPANVETLGVGVFRNCRSLRTVMIADGSKIKAIPNGAFSGCGALESIRIPAGVAELAKPADAGDDYGTYSIFTDCTSLKSITFEDNSVLTKIGDSLFAELTSLESITLPASLTEIGYRAFYYCKALTSITIPASVKKLPEGLFYYCDNLKTVAFAQGSELEEIGNQAFYLCAGLESLSIPAEVKRIGVKAFTGCHSLATLAFEGNNISSIGESAFSECELLTSFTMPSSVTEVAASLFASCKALTTVILPEGITSIGDMAFTGCGALTTINLPESIVSLGTTVFRNSGLTSFRLPSKVTVVPDSLLYGSSSLTSVTLHNSVTSIGDSAFYGTGLTAFEVPQSVRSIGAGAFANTGLTEFSVNAANNNFSAIGGVLFSKDGKTLVSVPASMTGSYTVPKNVNVAENAFTGSRLTEVIISSGVTVGSGAFTGSYIRKVTFESATTVGEYAFRNCRYLEEIVLGNRVTSFNIGRSAFEGCTSLTEFTVNSLTRLEITIGINAFASCVNLVKLSITAKSVNISDSAFEGDLFEGSALKTVEITSDGAVTIGESAFKYCTGLQSLKITAKGAVSVGENAFGEYTGKNTLETAEISGESITLGEQAFRMCNRLTDVRLTAQKSIELSPYAFSSCANLANVSMTASGDGSKVAIGKSSFSYCGNLVGVAFEASDITIDLDAFIDCTSVASIYLPSSVSYVEINAFENWTENQRILISRTEEQIANSRWDDEWRNGCNAQIVYGYVAEQA